MGRYFERGTIRERPPGDLSDEVTVSIGELNNPELYGSSRVWTGPPPVIIYRLSFVFYFEEALVGGISRLNG